MVKSMTGYGRGEGNFGGRSITVEMRSVNNRYLDCNVRIPRLFLFAEDGVKSRIQKAISRGKVDVFVTIEGSTDDGVNIVVNQNLAASYCTALHAMAEANGLRDDLSVSLISRFPDVLSVEKAEEDSDAMAEAIYGVLALAIDDFNAMRVKEGDRLAADMLSRATTIENLVSIVEERSPQTVSEYRTKLENRMAEVLANTQLDPARILTEAAIFADKVAVDEETVRLRSHLSQMREMLEQGGATGRKLDFLIQEFNREANTIGSKCSDITITRHVVDIKAEIEKIREQVQNLE